MTFEIPTVRFISLKNDLSFYSDSIADQFYFAFFFIKFCLLSMHPMISFSQIIFNMVYFPNFSLTFIS